MAKHKNILPNSYVPNHSKKVLSANLNRLSKNSIVALCLLWSQTKHTQPLLPTDKPMTQAQYNKQTKDDFKAMVNNKWNKARIIDSAISKYWPNGLNLLQLAQVDCQLMVDNPNTYYWVSSTANDAWGNEVPLSLDPSSFLDNLAKHLSKLFMSYIYVCTHPSIPLIIIRTQVFDLMPNARNSRLGSQNPHITSHKPYFLAVPSNSPHLIHSPGEDLVSQVVLQVVESSLSVNPANSIHLKTPTSQKAIKSLQSMQILKGSSRFANSLAAWSPYADGVADISPLANSEKHAVMLEITQKPVTCDSNTDKFEAIANLRFKGSINGNLTSSIPYETLRHKKPKANPLSELGLEDSDSKIAKRARSSYSSLVPIRFAEFVLQEPYKVTGAESSQQRHTNIKLKLVGNDVFAGLHELAVKHNDPEKAVVDAKTLPSWLTGEEGADSGLVINGRFHRN